MASSAHAARLVKGAIKDASFIDSKNETDTIKLWESYKDQALLWRSLALLQIPTTLIALVFAVILWHTRHITLNVPREPLPGSYSAKDVPDQKFIEAATDFINLISTYTPATARTQFNKAKEMITEPLLTNFETEMVDGELRQIEGTGRTQVFFADPTKTMVARPEGTSSVLVQIDGLRSKIIASSELAPEKTRFVVTLTTVPRNVLNPLGIVINNVQRGVPQEETKK